MMQQVATKSSDIAALPIAIDTGKTADTAGENSTAFAEAFAQANPENKSSENKAKNADDVTDVHWRKSETSDKAKENWVKADVDADELPEKNVVNGDARDVSHGDKEDLLAEPEQQLVESERPHTRNQTEETDWLAYVDSIRNQETTSGVKISVDNGEELVTELDDGDIAPALPEAASDIADEFAHLIELLKGTPETNGEVSNQSATQGDEIQALADKIIDAIATLMDAESESEEGGQQAQVDNTEVTQMAAALLAMLGHHSETKSKREISGSEAQTAAGTETDVSSDAGLLVAMLQAELSGDTQGQAGSDNQPKSETGSGAENLAKVLAGMGDSSEDSDINIDQVTTALISDGKDATREIVSGAIVERVAAALPAGVSDSQKTEMKQSIAEAVSQYQKGLSEPGTETATLESVITQEIVNAEVMGREQAEQLVSAELRQIGMLAAVAINVTQSTTSSASTLQSAGQTSISAVNEVQQITAEQHDKHIQDNNKPVNIHQPEGQQQLAEKIRWMVNARNAMAEIRLDPPELGSMQVRVNVAGDSASVSFVVQSPQAKEALAQAEPRLRDMLAEQGIALGESVVSQQQQQGTGDGQSGNGPGGQGEFAGEPDDDTQISEQPLTRQAQGGIDDYA